MNLNRFLYDSLNLSLLKENTHKNRIKVYPHIGFVKVVCSPSVKDVCDPTWAILECDKELVNYYKWFLAKKGVKLDSLMCGSHISIVRGGTWDKVEEEYHQEHSSLKTPESFSLVRYTHHQNKWKYNDGQIIEFRYGDLVTNGVHWWLKVESQQLETMRKTLGLKPHPDFGFHVTIGKISEFKK